MAAARSSEGKPILASELLENALFCMHAQAAKNPYDLPVVLGIRGARFTGQPTDIIPDDKEESAQSLKDGLALVVKVGGAPHAQTPPPPLLLHRGALSPGKLLPLRCPDRRASWTRRMCDAHCRGRRALRSRWCEEAGGGDAAPTRAGATLTRLPLFLFLLLPHLS